MKREKLQKIALKIFFPAMYLCAGFMLLAIWTGAFEGPDNEWFAKIIPTFFIIGLGSIITWAVLVILEFLSIAKRGK